MERAYRQAMKAHPENRQVSVNFADFYLKLQQYPQAERLYHQQIELDPHWVWPVTNLAYICAYIKKDYDEAERLYRKAAELMPNESYYITNLAQFYHVFKQDYEQAERQYRKALEVNPRDAPALDGLANIVIIKAGKAEGEARQKLAEEAEQLLRKAIEVNPKEGKYHANLANILLGLGENRRQEALAEAQKAIVLGYREPHPAFKDLGLNP